jgi:hypothetical protein
MSADLGAVVIGMNPHERSATIEVMAGDQAILGGGRFATDAAGYKAMLAFGGRYAQRTWAIEGCQGIGRHTANRLLADGEQVVDVPAGRSPPRLSMASAISAGADRNPNAIRVSWRILELTDSTSALDRPCSRAAWILSRTAVMRRARRTAAYVAKSGP